MNELIGKIFVERIGLTNKPSEITTIIASHPEGDGFYKDIYIVLTSSGRLLWKSGAYCKGILCRQGRHL